MDAEVVVVGGGPAGAAAAITLARAGRDVVLFDKARFPRDKCCGDGLTAAALRELEGLGLRPESVEGWQAVDDVYLRSPSGRVVHLPLPRGQGQFAACDPLTGEGIAQAQVTGRRAAEAVMAAGSERPGRAAEDYERAVRDELFADHRLGSLLGRGLSHRKGARIAIRAAGATGWTRRNFARWLFEDYPRAVLATPGRWQRRMFTAPGAYAHAERTAGAA